MSRLGLQRLLLGLSLLIEPLLGYNVLMATMGGTKSHTVPFVALGTNLRSRGHNVTLLSAFPGPAANNGLHELVPSILEVIYNLPRTSVSPCSRRRGIPNLPAEFLPRLARAVTFFQFGSRPIFNFITQRV